ncbi:MAG: hypothetical protein ACLS5C_08070 [Waltera sp.]
MNIREEDEITMCELFEQYVRMGKREGDKKEDRRNGRVVLSIDHNMH